MVRLGVRSRMLPTSSASPRTGIRQPSELLPLDPMSVAVFGGVRPGVPVAVSTLPVGVGVTTGSVGAGTVTMLVSFASLQTPAAGRLFTSPLYDAIQR